MECITLDVAGAGDAAAIASLRAAAAHALTSRYGKGPWSSSATERGVLFDMRRSKVFVARARNGVIATVTLSTTKPWAIDRRYFSPCEAPLYLTSMAVDPALQRTGIGRQCLDHVRSIATVWESDAIRLDAYDAEAGAGDFYRKCGFREVGRTSYRNTPLIYFETFMSSAADATRPLGA